MMKPTRLLHMPLSLVVAFSLTPVWAQEAPAPSAPATAGLPLPAAMIRLAIPDVGAFDAALGGGFKKALYGTLPEDDGVAPSFTISGRASAAILLCPSRPSSNYRLLPRPWPS
jgi:hypothetical protein